MSDDNSPTEIPDEVADAAVLSEPEPPKPKAKLSYKATMHRDEAIAYFEAIIAGLRSGQLEFRAEDQHLQLAPAEALQIEVKAQRKGDKHKVVFEIEWSDAQRGLEILS